MTLSTRIAPLAALLGALATPVCGAQANPPALSSTQLAQTPMHQLIQQHIYPQLDYLFDKLAAEQMQVTLDGVAAFKSNDKFLPGKIAVGLSHVLLNTAPGDARLPERLRQ